jgi:enterochelin esterase-like enzyme
VGRIRGKDLVAHIDSRYRTLPAPLHRAIGGLSMGGHGALQLAMTYPGVFGVVGVHSPTLRGYGDAPAYFGDLAYFSVHDPVQLVKARPEQARALVLWLDVGEADWWFAPVSSFHETLVELGVAHAWRTYPGGHEGAYWKAQLVDYLHFYGAALAPAGKAGAGLAP